MSLVGPDGKPLNAKHAQQGHAQLVGFCVLKKLAGGVLDPMKDDKGKFAVFLDGNVAKQWAAQLANQELIPNADQKVVTPQMVSSEYIVIGMLAFAVVQGKIKNPDQLLAPAQGKVPS